MDIRETGIVPATRVRFSEAWPKNQRPYKFPSVASATPPFLSGMKRDPMVSSTARAPLLGFDL